MKILVVEDEKTLARVIKKGLMKFGYAVDVASDGEEAIFYYHLNVYDAIVLDLNLPKIDGIQVLRQIRSKDSEVKILILSARTKIEDRVSGLDEGANDYLIKPFDFMELEARIRALLRRKFTQGSLQIICKRLRVDTARRVAYIDEHILDLSRKEYAILEYLMMNKNTVISNETIIEHVWDSEVDLFSNSLKFHIHSLRKKLAVLGDKDFIITVRGCGYMVED